MEDHADLQYHLVLTMLFRAAETVGKIAELFYKNKQTVELLHIIDQVVFLLSKVLFKGLGKHDDFEGFMTCGANDDMGDVDTAIRDMALSLWLIVGEQTKLHLQRVSSKPQESSLLKKIILRYVEYVASDLEIITSQIRLFA